MFGTIAPPPKRGKRRRREAPPPKRRRNGGSTTPDKQVEDSSTRKGIRRKQHHPKVGVITQGEAPGPRNLMKDTTRVLRHCALDTKHSPGYFSCAASLRTRESIDMNEHDRGSWDSTEYDHASGHSTPVSRYRCHVCLQLHKMYKIVCSRFTTPLMGLRLPRR